MTACPLQPPCSVPMVTTLAVLTHCNMYYEVWGWWVAACKPHAMHSHMPLWPSGWHGRRTYAKLLPWLLPLLPVAEVPKLLVLCHTHL